VLMLLVSIMLQIVMTQNSVYMRQVQAASGAGLDAQISLLWSIFGCFLFGTAIMLSLPVLATALGGSAMMSMSTIIIAPVRFGAGALGGTQLGTVQSVSRGLRQAYSKERS
jgi:hypothetical protein